MDLKGKIEQNYLEFTNIIKMAEFSNGLEDIPAEEWFKIVLSSLNTIKLSKKKLFFLGNGASASISAHFAADFTKNGLIPSFCNTEGALLTCFSNDYCYEDAYMEMLKIIMSDGDGLIAVSSSGTSKNIVNAANFVKENFKTSPVITLSAFNPDNALRKIGNFNLYLAANDYNYAESGHAYYLHLLTDLFCNQKEYISRQISTILMAINEVRQS
ncbi:MAG: hypothetical protein PHC34_04155 [Candidatus Gastranaerophilales bacterium]|nr:hypothetical protein [Candidatus Gastranaerophilales bacterium]